MPGIQETLNKCSYYFIPIIITLYQTLTLFLKFSKTILVSLLTPEHSVNTEPSSGTIGIILFPIFRTQYGTPSN